jgi:hypothetical protein
MIFDEFKEFCTALVSERVTEFLGHRFLGRWIGRGGEEIGHIDP